MKYLIFGSVLLLAAICLAQPISKKNENQEHSRDKRGLLLGLGLAKGAALLGGLGAAKVIGAGAIGAGAIGAGIIGAGALHKLKYGGGYGYGHGYGHGGYGGYHGGYYPIKKSYIIEEPYEEVYVEPSIVAYPAYSSYPVHSSYPSGAGAFATAGSYSGGYGPSFSSASAYASSGSW